MSVPFVDLVTPSVELREPIAAAVARVMTSGRFVLGPETEALQNALADRSNAQFAVGVSSGTDALVAALSALRIGPGDRVLTTPYSFIASTTAICRVGARPVFADIELDSFNLDPNAVHAWLAAHPHAAHTLKAILPVDLFGQVSAIPTLRRLAAPRGLAIVEDAAQAVDASIPAAGDEPAPRVGALADVTCLSFYPTKNLGAAGEAGMVLTSRPQLAERLYALRNQGRDDHGLHRSVGGNFRLDEIQAAILRVKLPYLRRWTERRRAIAARYDEAFEGEPGIITPTSVWGRGHHVYHQYVVRLPDGRDRVRRALQADGIETMIYYPRPLHHQPSLSFLHISPQAFPNARRAAREALALPIHPYLSEEDQARVIAALRTEVRR